MRIVTFKRIRDFSNLHPIARTALEEWYHKLSRLEIKNLNDLKNHFSSVDYVGNERFVFNIKGNNYRLVAILIFASQKAYIRFIGTHAEYDKVDVTKI